MHCNDHEYVTPPTPCGGQENCILKLLEMELVEASVALPDGTTMEGTVMARFIEPVPAPYIIGADPVVLQIDDTFDPRLGVIAYDGYGNEIEFTIQGEVDTSVAGEYELIYRARANGKLATVTRNVTVERTGIKRTAVYQKEVGTDFITTLIINEKEEDFARNALLYGEVYREFPPLDNEHDYVFDSGGEVYWGDLILYRAFIGSPIKPKSMAYWFLMQPHLKELDLNGIDSSDCESFRFTFGTCASLEELDVSMLSTSSAVDMADMFSGCSSLTTLDCHTFDTSNVQAMPQMFYRCTNLTELNIRGFDTSKVMMFDEMFANNINLTTIYMDGSFDTSSYQSGFNMFYRCISITGSTGIGYDPTRTGIDMAGCDGYFLCNPEDWL